MPPTAPPRSAPPSAPPRGMPLPAPPAGDDFDDAALVEDAAYDATGDDYVVALGDGIEHGGEPTAIGGAPEDGLLVAKRGKRSNDW